MEWLSNIGNWISENEALLSGLAAMIVVTSVLFSPVGLGIRRFLGRPQPQQGGSVAPAAGVIQEPQAVTDTVPGSVPDRASIAVLPFMNMSDDSEQAFLADGMTEDIITGLAATPHLHVVARNSTFAYKGQAPDIRQVGHDLGVRYVLEGSVRRVRMDAGVFSHQRLGGRPLRHIR